MTVMRGLAAVALAAALVGALAACGSPSLEGRDRVQVHLGQVLDPSTTTSVQGKKVTVMLPSGRADLTLTKPTHTVPAEDVKRAAPLVAKDGTAIVGVSWSLQRAAFPDTANYQPTSPDLIFGDPKPVTLTLVTDGTRRAIPHVDTLAEPVQRASNAVWLVVPQGVRSWTFEVGYDGVTQTVDAVTGRVDAGVAAPLYRDLPRKTDGNCTLHGKDIVISCLLDSAVGYPYVRGAGWAPAGKTFALVEVSVDIEAHPTDVTLAGARSVGRAGDNVTPFDVFLVQPGKKLALRATALVENDDGKDVRTPLSAEIVANRSTP